MIDLFISYASEDKDALARPLATLLRDRGWSVWFDEFELVLGDSLRTRIDQGLAEARFGLVILSPSFFAKRWTRRELDGLTAREMAGEGRKVILPVWHEVDHDYVQRFSPPLADRLAMTSSAGINAILEQVERVLQSDQTGSGASTVAESREIPPDQLEQLRVLASRHGVAVTEVLRRAIANQDFLATVQAADSETHVTNVGDTYDKYGTTNRGLLNLMRTFDRTLDELFRRADPGSLLDVGCGEGVLTHRWAQRLKGRRVVGIDYDDPVLKALWEQRHSPNLTFDILSGPNLPYGDSKFEVASAVEVLEHLPDPKHMIAELTRVASSYVLVSVPREPLWRGLNLARGAYLRQLGNTPGHLNHWSKRGFVELLSAYGDVVEARSPFPWIVLLVRL